MPPLEYLDLTDKAMMWEIVRTDRDGFPLLSSPEEISVRWEEGQVDMLDATGQLVRVDVTLATTRNIPNGSLLWEGSEDDLLEAYADSTPTRDIYEVITRERAKDLKGRVTRYEFGLKRYKDALPQVVS